MFNWLKRKDEIDQQTVLTYAGHVPPVEIPEPPATPKADISEPVVTLLEMLKRDEWEVGGYDDAFTSSISNKYLSYSVVNVFKEQLSLHVMKTEYGLLDRRHMSEDTKLELRGKSWMTAVEMETVAQSVIKRVADTKALQHKHNQEVVRKAFAKLINVEVE